MEMKILKITGIIIGSLIGVFALIFFLYPYINKDHYNELIGVSNEAPQPWTVESDVSDEELELMQMEIEELQAANTALRNTIDSLELVNEDLRLEIQEWENLEDFRPVAGASPDEIRQGGMTVMSDEDFSERVKSLLNLDEEELAPIIRELEKSQLVRLYQSGGTIQREKLLRSLEPQRAARLMSEVML